VKSDNKATIAECVVRELRAKLCDLQKDYEEEKVSSLLAIEHSAVRGGLLVAHPNSTWSVCLLTLSQKRTFALASDMTRQYKRKVEDMLREKSEEAQLRMGVEDRLAALQLSKAQLERELLQRIQLKEAEIAEQKSKMDEMAHEFGQMLKQTLDKMSEKIEVTNDWEAGGAHAAAQGARLEPVVRTFEDFHLGPGRWSMPRLYILLLYFAFSKCATMRSSLFHFCGAFSLCIRQPPLQIRSRRISSQNCFILSDHDIDADAPQIGRSITNALLEQPAAAAGARAMQC
jgi:hypothetical protein